MWTVFVILLYIVMLLFGSASWSVKEKNVIRTGSNDATRRSNRLQIFYKLGVLNNFAKFTGKRLFCSGVIQPATLLKERLLHRCFPMNFANTNVADHLRTTAFVLSITKAEDCSLHTYYATKMDSNTSA